MNDFHLQNEAISYFNRADNALKFLADHRQEHFFAWSILFILAMMILSLFVIILLLVLLLLLSFYCGTRILQFNIHCSVLDGDMWGKSSMSKVYFILKKFVVLLYAMNIFFFIETQPK